MIDTVEEQAVEVVEFFKVEEEADKHSIKL